VIILSKISFKLITMMALSLLFGSLLILFLYDNPAKGMFYFLIKPIQGSLFTGNTLNRTSLFLLSGTAVMFAFKGGEFNLGGEGQICLGGLSTTLFLLTFPQLNPTVGIIIALIMAIFSGIIMGALSAYLKNRYKINEVISTYMLSMGIIQVSRYLINGPFKDENSFLITSETIGEKFFFNQWLIPSQLNISFAISIIIIFFAYIYIYHTPQGYDWRLAGVNKAYAQYCGINTKKHTLKVLTISGGLHGLTGGLAILGTYHRALQDFFTGFGWNGMAVSLIAGNNPLLILPSAYFFSHVSMGANFLKILGRFPLPLDSIIIAFIFLLVTAGRKQHV
jgi:ABC-type uncharacterized transport system permease subunit